MTRAPSPGLIAAVAVAVAVFVIVVVRVAACLVVLDEVAVGVAAHVLDGQGNEIGCCLTTLFLIRHDLAVFFPSTNVRQNKVTRKAIANRRFMAGCGAMTVAGNEGS